MALCQKPVKLARCRNVGMLTGQGRWPKTTYTPPIPTSFFHATATVALTPQPIMTLITASFSMYTSILMCPVATVACTTPSTYMFNDTQYSWLTAQSKGQPHQRKLGQDRGESLIQWTCSCTVATNTLVTLTNKCMRVCMYVYCSITVYLPMYSINPIAAK